MDHRAAAAAFERLALNLDAAADHLIGPGFEFTRRALTNAGGAASELAGLYHAAPEYDAGDYVRDLLGPDALDAVDPLPDPAHPR